MAPPEQTKNDPGRERLGSPTSQLPSTGQHSREHSGSSSVGELLSGKTKTGNKRSSVDRYTHFYTSGESSDEAPRLPSPVRPRTETLDEIETNRFIEEVVEEPLRQFAPGPNERLRTPVTEQRYPGRPGGKIEQIRSQYDNPTLDNMDEKETGSAARNEQPPPDENSIADEEFVTGFPLVCLVIGLMLAVFLISIDRTIISTVSEKCKPFPVPDLC